LFHLFNFEQLQSSGLIFLDLGDAIDRNGLFDSEGCLGRTLSFLGIRPVRSFFLETQVRLPLSSVLFGEEAEHFVPDVIRNPVGIV
jgi:hypothetical protein